MGLWLPLARTLELSAETWFLLVGMPALIVMLAIVAYFSGETRTTKRAKK